ncbi:unnamed protein product, partial [Laminaria digitata]
SAWESFASGAQEPTILSAGEPATPSETDVYQIALEDPLLLVLVELSDAGAFALFLEHDTDEEDHHDEDEHEEEHEDEDEDEDTSPATGAQWANALVAATVVSVCSFAGLLVMMSGRVAQSIDLSHASIFASGALLTASLAHIIPEAMEGMQPKYGDNLHDLGIHAGLALLIGITFGVVVHALLASSHSHSHGNPQPCHQKATAHVVAGGGACGAAQVGSVNNANNAVSLQALMKQRSGKALLDVGSLQSVCWTVIIGDLVHNFADGVTIGAAFLGCSSVVGWTVTASVVVHEVPHELADFMALIKGGMSAYQ